MNEREIAMPRYLLALDQGTTSSRAILFDEDQNIVARLRRRNLPQYLSPSRLGGTRPDGDLLPALRRHDGGHCHSTDIHAAGDCCHRHHEPARDHRRLGQGRPASRSATPSSGSAAAPRRICDELQRTRARPTTSGKTTGLLLDAYFSGTKIKWILDNVPGARERAERGELLFGTVDTWLIWKLTGGRVHVTDYTNASPHDALSTSIRCDWDEELSAGAGHPRMHAAGGAATPAAVYGSMRSTLRRARSRSRASPGDQQAALFGQACFQPGRRQKHLRHGLLSADEHRVRPVCRAATGL